MGQICRRNFLSRCSLAAVGGLLLPLVTHPASGLEAVAPVNTSLLLGHDREVLQTLSAYSGDAYFYGGNVFARAAGVAQTSEPVRVLVLVRDFGRLAAFFGSPGMKRLGVVRVDGNNLSFTYRGTAYVITNQSAAEFQRTVSGLSGSAAADKQAALYSLFSFQNVLYHPATGEVLDAGLALKSRRIELTARPEGSLKSQFETLVQGWLFAKHYDLTLGKSFLRFQDELLAFTPTANAAESVSRVWTQNLVALSSLYGVEELRPLVSSPLVAGSVEQVFALDAQAILERVKSLRGDKAANAAYPDAPLWLAALLLPEIAEGTASQWLAKDDGTIDAASLKALRMAGELAAPPDGR